MLAVEENPKATRRLRELLLGFGAAGRQSVEKLKNSPNPAVRRTAIDLLRAFGGQEALPELVSMLNDADPQVQRESIRAIVQIGTNNAYAVLQRALVSKSATRETVLQELLGLRDDKAAPLLCYVLKQTQPTGRFLKVHLDMIDALGNLRGHPESIRTLKHVAVQRQHLDAVQDRRAPPCRRVGPETHRVGRRHCGSRRSHRQRSRAAYARPRKPRSAQHSGRRPRRRT